MNNSEIGFKKILVTGGVGYIGSHTCIELINSGFDVVVYDNLSNSNIEALNRVEKIVGKDIEFIKGDVRDKELLIKTFENHNFYGVMHFAGLKAVGESVDKPLKYYDNNICGTINLLDVMKQFDIGNIVFSSSATVYGEPQELPIPETARRSCTNPYGQSKLTIEFILEDLSKSDSIWNIICLRYFNPVGAHESGLIGEDPNDIPNNLMPYISQVAVGKLDILSVFGSDYDTPDGTGVRDFIHVVDLAKGHVSALRYLDGLDDTIGFEAINLGTGKGTTVLQLINDFIQVTNRDVPFQITDRREGDIASCYASSNKAKELLKWTAQFSVVDMCRDTWRWQSQNPNGYRS